MLGKEFLTIDLASLLVTIAQDGVRCDDVERLVFALNDINNSYPELFYGSGLLELETIVRRRRARA